MVVAPLVADLVVLSFLALRDVAGDLHFLWWVDFFARPSPKVVVQDVASEAVEVHRADTMVERRIGDVFTCAAVVAGVGITGAVSGELTLGTSEELRAQTLGSLAARDAGATIVAVEAAACLGVIITCRTCKALQELCKKINILKMYSLFIVTDDNDHL